MTPLNRALEEREINIGDGLHVCFLAEEALKEGGTGRVKEVIQHAYDTYNVTKPMYSCDRNHHRETCRIILDHVDCELQDAIAGQKQKLKRKWNRCQSQIRREGVM